MLNLTKKELICSRISFYKKLECSVSLITDEAKHNLKVKKLKLLKEYKQLEKEYYHLQNEGIADKLFNTDIELEHLDYDLETIVELEIMYLYKSYEYNIKKIISWSFPSVNTRSLGSFPQVISLMSKKGIDIKQCNNFDQVDSLRELNNCIKHNGSLRKQDFKRVHCDNICQLNEFVIRIKGNIEAFLAHLIEAVSRELMLNDSSEMNERQYGIKSLLFFATSGGRYI